MNNKELEAFAREAAKGIKNPGRFGSIQPGSD